MRLEVLKIPSGGFNTAAILVDKRDEGRVIRGVRTEPDIEGIVATRLINGTNDLPQPILEHSKGARTLRYPSAISVVCYNHTKETITVAVYLEFEDEVV